MLSDVGRRCLTADVAAVPPRSRRRAAPLAPSPPVAHVCRPPSQAVSGRSCENFLYGFKAARRAARAADAARTPSHPPGLGRPRRIIAKLE